MIRRRLKCWLFGHKMIELEDTECSHDGENYHPATWCSRCYKVSCAVEFDYAVIFRRDK